MGSDELSSWRAYERHLREKFVESDAFIIERFSAAADEFFLESEEINLTNIIFQFWN